MPLAMCEHCRFRVGESEEWVKLSDRLYHMRCWDRMRQEGTPALGLPTRVTGGA